jgi:hypothetical protein
VGAGPAAADNLDVRAARGASVRRRLLVLAAALVVVGALAETASASFLLARNARDVTLKVNDKGQGLVTYRDASGWHRVLVWGAVNARPPDRSRPQVKFRVDYSGGSGTFGYPVWKTFRNTCRAYDGPPLAWKLRACKASNGSYWALQRWQRMLPNYGVRPWKAAQKVWELRVSHWTGAPAKLEIWLDWIYGGRHHHLFGRLTYRGNPVYGFGSTSAGSPTDSYGRNVYLDTYNSAYGSGFKRENSFLTHRPKGNFCYGFFRHRLPSWYPNAGAWRPAGDGAVYRATVIGPGVTPDVKWASAGLSDYDSGNPDHVQHEQDMNALGDSLIAGDPDDNCTQH